MFFNFIKVILLTLCKKRKEYKVRTLVELHTHPQSWCFSEIGKQRISSIEQQQRPSIEAIMEATTPGYHDNSLNAPLVSSLKPKRV